MDRSLAVGAANKVANLTFRNLENLVLMVLLATCQTLVHAISKLPSRVASVCRVSSMLAADSVVHKVQKAVGMPSSLVSMPNPL